MKICTFFLSFFFSLYLITPGFSQDIIHPKKGDEIMAKITNTTATEVEYKLFYFQDGASFKIKKEDISYIMHPDGVRETFDSPQAKQENGTTATIVSGNLPDNGGNLGKNLDKLTVQLDAFNKGQTGQSKELNETLQALNITMISLKTTLEQDTKKTQQQNEMTLARLDSLNSSMKTFKGPESTATSAENSTPRVFGFGVSILTNYMQGLTDHNGTDTYMPSSSLYMGAGISFVIQAGMKKKVGFRIEPEFDFASESNKVTSNGNTDIERSSIFNAGSKFELVFRRGKVNIYTGPSISGLALINSLAATGSPTTTTTVPGFGFGWYFGG